MLTIGNDLQRLPHNLKRVNETYNEIFHQYIEISSFAKSDRFEVEIVYRNKNYFQLKYATFWVKLNHDKQHFRILIDSFSHLISRNFLSNQCITPKIRKSSLQKQMPSLNNYKK